MMKSAANLEPSTEPTQCTSLEDEDNLAAWECMFADRFTEKDPHYRPYLNKDSDLPPILDNYYVRKPRQYDNAQRGGGGGWHGGQKRRYEDRDNQRGQGGYERRDGGGWEGRRSGGGGHWDNKRYDQGNQWESRSRDHRGGHGGDRRRDQSRDRGYQEGQKQDGRQGRDQQRNDRDGRQDRHQQSNHSRTDNRGSSKQEWD